MKNQLIEAFNEANKILPDFIHVFGSIIIILVIIIIIIKLLNFSKEVFDNPEKIEEIRDNFLIIVFATLCALALSTPEKLLFILWAFM